MYDDVFDIPFMISFWNQRNVSHEFCCTIDMFSSDIDVTYILKIENFSEIGKLFVAKDPMHITPCWYHKHEEIFMTQILVFEWFLKVFNMPKTL